MRAGNSVEKIVDRTRTAVPFSWRKLCILTRCDGLGIDATQVTPAAKDVVSSPRTLCALLSMRKVDSLSCCCYSTSRDLLLFRCYLTRIRSSLLTQDREEAARCFVSNNMSLTHSCKGHWKWYDLKVGVRFPIRIP